jgi:hypothetical protein
MFYFGRGQALYHLRLPKLGLRAVRAILHRIALLFFVRAQKNKAEYFVIFSYFTSPGDSLYFTFDAAPRSFYASLMGSKEARQPRGHRQRHLFLAFFCPGLPVTPFQVSLSHQQNITLYVSKRRRCIDSPELLVTCKHAAKKVTRIQFDTNE